MRLCASLAAAAMALSSPARALAQELYDGFYLPAGVHIGGAFRAEPDEDGPHGFTLGGEASFVRFWREGWWVGGYADGLWDFGVDRFRHSFGPEVGYGFFGAELGYLGEADSNGYDPGVIARGVLTISVVSLTGGYGHVFRGDGDEHQFGELGGLIKFPIPIITYRPEEPWRRGLEPYPVDRPPPPPPPE